MEFRFSEMQSIIIDSARSFLRKEAKGAIREAEGTQKGYSPDLWQKMADLGWLGVVFPEDFGGIGGNFVDLVLILEEMGKALFPGPFIAGIVSGLAILNYGTESQKKEFLSKIAEGRLLVSPALMTPDLKICKFTNNDKVDTTSHGTYVVRGTRLFVPYAHVADLLIYGAYTDRGTSLFLIDATAPRISCTPLESIGATKPCEVTLAAVELPKDRMLGEAGKGEEIVNRMNEWGALAESAYIVGILEQVLEMSVEYAKEREQFGKKIGGFQAIQHHTANMATDVDQAKYLTYEAAWRLSKGLQARKEISMAKAWASDASRRCTLLGVTIHGGTGVSEEHDMQLYFRRAKASEIASGDGVSHRSIVAEELGL